MRTTAPVARKIRLVFVSLGWALLPRDRAAAAAHRAGRSLGDGSWLRLRRFLLQGDVMRFICGRALRLSARLLIATGAVFALWVSGAMANGITVTEGVPFSGAVDNTTTFLACFSSPVTIDWGDGSTSSGTVDINTNDITGSHTYTEAGSYSGSVTWFSDDGACTPGIQMVDTFIATVADAALSSTGIAISGTDSWQCTSGRRRGDDGSVHAGAQARGDRWPRVKRKRRGEPRVGLANADLGDRHWTKGAAPLKFHEPAVSAETRS